MSCGGLVLPTAGTEDKASSAAAARTQLNYNAWPGQQHPEHQNTPVIPQCDTRRDRDSGLDFLRLIKIDLVLGNIMIQVEQCPSRFVGTLCAHR